MMKMNKPVRLKSKFASLFFILSHQVPSISTRSHSFCLFCLFGLLIVVSNS
ncbi:hypothetical protein HanXRQr2_Chr13g0583611 [Helianthus annuus]|uniref:Uncharacterized protein n=1 Tax=Helianthus annuus TaxID=4232 RepID=A0A251SB10_HELAN|nr:hypothetical protein HanXRQr2_Chr13g0583611 [Helianthus annuus]